MFARWFSSGTPQQTATPAPPPVSSQAPPAQGQTQGGSAYPQYTAAEIARFDPTGRCNCPYDNLFHQHLDPRPTEPHSTVSEIVGSKLGRQSKSGSKETTGLGKLGQDPEICKCHRAVHGFDIVRKTLTHREGRLYPPISNPLCMLCSKRIGLVEQTLTHAELRPDDFTCDCDPCHRYTQILTRTGPKPSAPAHNADNPAIQNHVPRVEPVKVKVFCGQTYHLDCALKYIEEESWAHEVKCPGCRTVWPVKHGIVRKIGRWFGSFI